MQHGHCILQQDSYERFWRKNEKRKVYCCRFALSSKPQICFYRVVVLRKWQGNVLKWVLFRTMESLYFGLLYCSLRLCFKPFKFRENKNDYARGDYLPWHSRLHLSFATCYIFLPSHLSAFPSACCFEGNYFSLILPSFLSSTNHLADFQWFSFFPPTGSDPVLQCPFLVPEPAK